MVVLALLSVGMGSAEIVVINLPSIKMLAFSSCSSLPLKTWTSLISIWCLGCWACPFAQKDSNKKSDLNKYVVFIMSRFWVKIQNITLTLYPSIVFWSVSKSIYFRPKGLSQYPSTLFRHRFEKENGYINAETVGALQGLKWIRGNKYIDYSPFSFPECLRTIKSTKKLRLLANF